MNSSGLWPEIPPQRAVGVYRVIILLLPPHPTPLPPGERGLAETPAQADGVLKTHNKAIVGQLALSF